MPSADGAAMQADGNARVPICITGMHRSGTSMVAMLLHACDVYLGPEQELIPRARDNDEGFWEHKQFVQLNDDILAALGGGWDLPPAPAPGWEHGLAMDPFVERARELIAQFEGRQMWGWKDPRNSLTLPFWQRLFPDLRVVICVRDPMEVMGSLKKRSYHSEAFGLNLWEIYNRHLIQSAVPGRSVVTHYDAYFNDPAAELTRLLETLAIPHSREVIERACGAVSLSLRHNRSTRKRAAARRTIPAGLESLYAELCAQAGPVYRRMLETVRSAAPATQLPSTPVETADDGTIFPLDMPMIHVSRHPTTLAEETIEAALATAIPVPAPASRQGAGMVPQGMQKRVSVVVVTFNNLAYTRLCLSSVLANTVGLEFEIVIVDNGSTDGTREFLQALAAAHENVRVILNTDNAGFARANNEGLAASTGEILVLLNNDTVVPPGWLTGLVRHLEDDSVGLAGPVTNRCGNEAEIEVPYRTYGSFLEFSRDYQQEHQGARSDIPVLIMFCMAMRRSTFERLGPLDDRYDVGMFEDDDYSMRARANGYRLICAEDVFVHHFGQASLGTLVDSGGFGGLFHQNRKRFEEKWGVSWETHRHRFNPDYERVSASVRESIKVVVPAGAIVLVVSRGDDALLDLGDRHGEHFPQTDDGEYAGYHPASSEAAIRHLHQLQARGAQYLVFPRTAFWWLEHYAGLSEYLRGHSRLVVDDDQSRIYALGPAAADSAGISQRETA